MKHDQLPLCNACGISHEGPQDSGCQVILDYKDGSQEYGWQALLRRGSIVPQANPMAGVVN